MDELEITIFSDFPFEFVFLIPFRNVDRNCSLAELVADEHDLQKEDVEIVKSILTGKTKHKVLLLLDGYDEYNPGTNTELDQAVEKTIGRCLLIVTSRPQDGIDFTERIKKKMDGEVVIKGFNQENIEECCSKYLRKKAGQFLNEARQIPDLYELLKVPIILLMTSVLFNEGESKTLPKRKTKLYEDIYEFVINRTTLKPHNFGCYSSEVPNIRSMLQALGKYAWNALQRDVRQLLIEKASLNFNSIDKLSSLAGLGAQRFIEGVHTPSVSISGIPNIKILNGFSSDAADAWSV